MVQIKLHDTKSRRREVFVPIDPAHVTLYVCGNTVYDRAHIGNARPVVVFDVLVRLLRQVFPRVTYVRNITDVDDKINARARENGESIGDLTARTAADYQRDMAALFALPPDIEPRVTTHIGEIISMIERLIGRGHGYEAAGHVLFAVSSDADYGAFSGRSPDELLAGARVDVAAYKRDPGDFVLWKPSGDDQPGWDSPWGFGRPGWHIECSAMIWKHLGEEFDIHGGGDDLIFPHHENEIAQSTCAFPGSGFATYWLHNRMLLVDGEKMSKSLGNFVTVEQALARAPGEAVRFLLLKTHYRSTLDFTWAGLDDAKRELDRFYRALAAHGDVAPANAVPDVVLERLADDLNIPGAIAALHGLANAALGGDREAAAKMKATGVLLGIFNFEPTRWFQAMAVYLKTRSSGTADPATFDSSDIDRKIAERIAARRAKDFTRADAIRAELTAQNIILEDSAGGTTWRRT